MTVEEARQQTAAWLTEQGVDDVDVGYITQELIDSYDRGAREPDEAELAEHGEKNPEGIEAPPRPEGTEELWVNYAHNLLWMSTYLLWHSRRGCCVEALSSHGLGRGGRPSSGERGIRTLGRRITPSHDFQSCPFSRSGTSPSALQCS